MFIEFVSGADSYISPCWASYFLCLCKPVERRASMTWAQRLKWVFTNSRRFRRDGHRNLQPMRRRRLGATHPVAREPSATRSVSLDKQPAFSTHVAAARVPPAGISRNVAVNDHGGLGRERAFILPILPLIPWIVYAKIKRDLYLIKSCFQGCGCLGTLFTGELLAGFHLCSFFLVVDGVPLLPHLTTSYFRESCTTLLNPPF